MSSGRSLPFGVGLGIMLVTVAMFSGTLGHDFINYDDNLYVTSNPQVQAGLTPSGIAWAFRTQHSANWHPLTWLSHMLDVSLFGMRPGGHHLMSVLLHGVNAALLFAALFCLTGALWASALTGLLFALHPLHVESVAWVAERKDVLSTFFWMLTLLAYVFYVARPTVGRYLLVAASLALGLLAKPMLVTVPFTLLLLDIWPLGRWAPWKAAGGGKTSEKKGKNRRAASGPIVPKDNRSVGAKRVWGEKVPLILLVMASSVVTWMAQRGAGAMRFSATFPLGLRLENAIVSYAAYLGKTIWPNHLCILYPHRAMTPAWKVAMLPPEQVALAAMVLLFISMGAFMLRRRFPFLLVGWLWYLGTLVPVVGIVQVGTQAMADRYTYVPLVGIFIALVWGMAALARRLRLTRPVLVGGTVVVFAALATVTFVQAATWTNSITVWSQALRATKVNPVAQYNLAYALRAAGKNDEAIPHLAAAVRIAPTYTEAHLELIGVLEATGRTDQAAVAHYNYGIALRQRGDGAQAVTQFREALRLKPDYPEAASALQSSQGGASR
jgi:protein O-mannosyl-transferase